jgi:hypothetical protein
LNLRTAWLARGADVRLHVTRGSVDHITGAVAGVPVALGWLARRLGATGTPAPDLGDVLVTEGEAREAA